MVKSKIIKKLKIKYPNLNLKQIQSIFDIIFETMSENFIKNNNIEIRKLGTFTVKKIKKKVNARNPKTGETIIVPERKKISFKMSTYLKDKINNKI